MALGPIVVRSQKQEEERKRKKRLGKKKKIANETFSLSRSSCSDSFLSLHLQVRAKQRSVFRKMRVGDRQERRDSLLLLLLLLLSLSLARSLSRFRSARFHSAATTEVFSFLFCERTLIAVSWTSLLRALLEERGCWGGEKKDDLQRYRQACQASSEKEH